MLKYINHPRGWVILYITNTFKFDLYMQMTFNSRPVRVEPSWVLKVQICLYCFFFFFFFKHELSLSSSPNKILCSSLAHFLVVQARACSHTIWLTYSFPIYCETMTKMFFLFTILWILTTNIINNLQIII